MGPTDEKSRYALMTAYFLYGQQNSIAPFPEPMEECLTDIKDLARKLKGTDTLHVEYPEMVNFFREFKSAADVHFHGKNPDIWYLSHAYLILFITETGFAFMQDGGQVDILANVHGMSRGDLQYIIDTIAQHRTFEEN